jgi:hypothetical protein
VEIPPETCRAVPDINKLFNVASCWIYSYIKILLGARPILHISRIRVTTNQTNNQICKNTANVNYSCREHPVVFINPLNAELNPICHFLALLGAHHIPHVSRIRVKLKYNKIDPVSVKHNNMFYFIFIFTNLRIMCMQLKWHSCNMGFYKTWKCIKIY